MSTMGEVVDRVFRDYLHAGDDQPARIRLGAAVDATQTAWTLDLSMLPVDARQVIAGGMVVEFDREQVLVLTFDGSTATVVREANGTTAAAHAAGTLGVISPPFSRQVVFDAVADNVVDLYPSVWGTASTALTVTQPVTEVPETVGQIVVFRAAYGSGYWTADARLVTSFPASATGRGAVIEASAGTAGTLVYRSSFARPSDDATDLQAIGVRPEWERIVVVGAAAQLLSGRDVEAVTQEHITEQMQAESLPVTTPGRISARLTQLHDYLLDRAGKRLISEEGKRIRRVPVARTAVR